MTNIFVRKSCCDRLTFPIEAATKYVDSHSSVGGDLRAPRNRFKAYFRCVAIAVRPEVGPYQLTSNQHISSPEQ